MSKVKGCRVEAGQEVKIWDGKLTQTQCAAFPALGEQEAGDRISGFGRGSFASAYQHADDPTKVVKFTADAADAEASALVAETPLNGTVRVFKVARLKGQTGTAPVMNRNWGDFEDQSGLPIYGIITEKVEKLTEAQERSISEFWGQYRRSSDIFQSSPPKKFQASDHVDFLSVVNACRLTIGISGQECWDTAMDVFAAVNEQAHEIGVIPLDIPARNWGNKNGKPVILDLGVSAGREAPQIETLAGTGAKGKKMAKRKHRRSLGQADMAVFDPSRPSRVTGFNWSNPWVIGGAVAALGLIAWFAFGGKKDKKKTSSTSSGSSAAPASGGGVVLPATASSTTPTAPQRVRAASGDSWSVIAKKYYGDTRWWPALWDANRSGGSKFSDTSLLRVGDEVVVPVLPVTDSAFRAAVFARAKAYQTWYRNTGGTSSRSNPLPATVTEFTSAPTQNAAAGTQVSSQTAAESSSGQKALPPASSSTPMSAEEKLQSDAEDAWSSLDNMEG